MVVQSHAHIGIRCPSGCRACVWGGARGWNADQFGRQLRLPLVRPVVSSEAVGVERGGCGEPVVGTLLGPEGAGHPGNRVSHLVRAGLSVVPLCSLWGGQVWRWSGVGVWSYVENCTVDASIFWTL